MHRFIYSSHSVAPLDQSDLEVLLGTSRQNNERDGLTGILVHVRTEDPTRSAFVQLLEGDREVIEATYSRILRDDLHTGPHVLVDDATPARIFPTWSMRLERVMMDSAELDEGLRDVDAMQKLVYAYPG